MPLFSTEVLLVLAVVSLAVVGLAIWLASRTRNSCEPSMAVRDTPWRLKNLLPVLVAVFAVAVAAVYVVDMSNATIPGEIGGIKASQNRQASVSSEESPSSPAHPPMSESLQRAEPTGRPARQDHDLEVLRREVAAVKASLLEYERPLAEYQRMINQLRADLGLAEQVANERTSQLEDVLAGLRDAQRKQKSQEVELAKRDRQLAELQRELTTLRDTLGRRSEKPTSAVSSRSAAPREVEPAFPATVKKTWYDSGWLPARQTVGNSPVSGDWTSGPQGY